MSDTAARSVSGSAEFSWAVAYSEQIKTIVNKQNKVGEGRGSRKLAAAAAAANAAANAETEELSIELKPLGLDRNKNRIWSLDRKLSRSHFVAS